MRFAKIPFEKSEAETRDWGAMLSPSCAQRKCKFFVAQRESASRGRRSPFCRRLFATLGSFSRTTFCDPKLRAGILIGSFEGSRLFFFTDMPLLTLCCYPGCHRPVPRGERYCDAHAKAGAKRDAEIEAKAKAARDARRRQVRGTTAQRGYGGRWQTLRRRFILQHPYCQECLKQGKLVEATDVDHIVPHRGCAKLLFDEANLQSLCHECHSRKTAKEDGGFGNPQR